MKEVEITEIAPLTDAQIALFSVHSLLNVYNVLRGELVLIGLELANDDDLLAKALSTCDCMTAALRDPTRGEQAARDIEPQLQQLEAELQAGVARFPHASEHHEVEESLANIASVCAILRVRAREVLARLRAAEPWQSFSIRQLEADFMAMFAAVEKNSRGRFRLVVNGRGDTSGPYYHIDFKVEAAAADLLLPAVFPDVMRDLIMNSRKYTPVGGQIRAVLAFQPLQLELTVEDNGRGIPEAELNRVVSFGERASNVSEVRTMGGGFGLTKAFYITRQFGGHFHIASEVGRGTKVRIVIPVPPYPTRR